MYGIVVQFQCKKDLKIPKSIVIPRNICEYAVFKSHHSMHFFYTLKIIKG